MKMKLMACAFLFVAQTSYCADNALGTYQLFVAKDESDVSDLYVGNFLCEESLMKIVAFATSCGIDASVGYQSCSCPLKHTPAIIFSPRGDENKRKILYVLKRYGAMDPNPHLVKKPSDHK